VRCLASLVATGVDVVHWFCFMLSPTSRHGLATVVGESATMGLHNDVDPGSGQYGLPFQAADAYPRPAWYSFRRLVWLLAAAPDAAEVLYAERGFVVLRFTSILGIHIGPAGESYSSGWRYAYLAWVDQHAANKSASNPDPRSGSGVFDLYDAANLGYQPLDLVPTIRSSRFASAVDGNGYAQVDSLRWSVSGGMAGVRSFPLDPGRVLVVSVPPANTTSRIEPVCFLTNAEFLCAN
jgi:hypothetical protein